MLNFINKTPQSSELHDGRGLVVVVRLLDNPPLLGLLSLRPFLRPLRPAALASVQAWAG